MKKTKKEKLEILNSISKPEGENARWKKIAKWNRDHAESLEDFTIIATRILQALKAKNMTQKELAAKLDVSPQALTRIVKGRQNLTLQSIRKFEKVLDITLISLHRQPNPMILNKVRFEYTNVQYSGKSHQVFSGNIDQLTSHIDSSFQEVKLKIAS